DTYVEGRRLYAFYTRVFPKWKCPYPSVERWIEVEIAPILEEKIFQEKTEDELMRLHGHLPGDSSEAALKRLEGIRRVKQRIAAGEDGVRAHREWNRNNADAVLTLGPSLTMSRRRFMKLAGTFFASLSVAPQIVVTPQTVTAPLALVTELWFKNMAK